MEWVEMSERGLEEGEEHALAKSEEAVRKREKAGQLARSYKEQARRYVATYDDQRLRLANASSEFHRVDEGVWILSLAKPK